MSGFAHIHGNLVRQWKGFLLLESLLEEEFSLLCANNTEAVGILEFSIHELLRQLAVERTDMKAIMQGTKAAEYAALLPEEEGEEMKKLLLAIDEAEQRCARHASFNTELSLALLDQSHSLMTFLHKNIQPKQEVVYGATGVYREHHIGATLFSGRL